MNRPGTDPEAPFGAGVTDPLAFAVGGALAAEGHPVSDVVAEETKGMTVAEGSLGVVALEPALEAGYRRAGLVLKCAGRILHSMMHGASGGAERAAAFRAADGTPEHERDYFSLLSDYHTSRVHQLRGSRTGGAEYGNGFRGRYHAKRAITFMNRVGLLDALVIAAKSESQE